MRPALCNRTYYSETVNDADGLLVNGWRSIQLHPDETAEWASWPVTEADLTARHLWLVRWREERNLERLMADPEWCDPRAAGYWMWGQSCWIGSGWCSGRGPWIVGPDGRIMKRKRTDDPGVHCKRPHLSNNGQGVNHADLREPGVERKRPHVSDNGQGVNRPQLREPGVKRQLPHVGDNGRGVNHGNLREPGVCEGTACAAEPDWHPMTMPKLREWFRFLSARLRHVRIINGDWTRAVTTGATINLSVREGKGPCGVFLDPPYSGEVRADGLYSCEGLDVARAVRAWCLEYGDDPRYRIVLAGFAGEGHEELEKAGWRVVEWFSDGYLTGGMAQITRREDREGPKHHQRNERLWLSPHCLRPTEPRQASLFESVRA
jgi:hypothetical protein